MPSDDKIQDRKTLILQATAKLLGEKGLQALSFENVAREAGLSRQLVRYYYTDMNGLIADLCDHLGTAYREMIVSGIVEIAQVERLKFFLDFLFDLADGYRMPDNLENYDALIAYSVGCDEVKERMCTKYQTLGQVISQELAISYTELDSKSCEELSFLFVSMMHAHWSFVASLGYSREHSLLIRGAIDRLIQSYIDDKGAKPRIKGPWSRDNSFSI